METNAMTSADWALITAQLPADWRDRAAAHGLCRSVPGPDGTERAKLKEPGLLLRLLLHHIGTESALDHTTAQAHAADLVTVSKVALHLRMRSAGPWLADLAAAVVGADAAFAADRWAGYRIFCTDGTSGTRPGACGTAFRVHYRLHAPTLRPTQVQFTDVTEGEMLRRFAIQSGDLDLLDRGYCNPPDIAHSVVHGGDVIVRFNRGTLPLRTPRGGPFDPVRAVFRMRRTGQVRSWAVWIPTATCAVRGRMIAVRLSADQAAAAQERLRREKGAATTREDLAWAAYVVLVTTVPRTVLPDAAILALFRLRWQVELQIKRDKSLGGLDHLPNFREDTTESWVCGKLLLHALARRLADGPFPPGAIRDDGARGDGAVGRDGLGRAA